MLLQLRAVHAVAGPAVFRSPGTGPRVATAPAPGWVAARRRTGRPRRKAPPVRTPLSSRLLAASASLGAVAALALGTVPPAAAYDASAAGTDRAGANAGCFTPGGDGASDAAARGGFGNGRDHREVTKAEQRAIEARTARLLQGKPGAGSGGLAPQGGTIATYVHVMAARNGTGDVSSSAIAQQISVLNSTYSGTGFTFTLAGTDRFYNDAYHAGPLELEVPLGHAQGRRERAEHLARRLRLPRHRDLPLGLQPQRRHRRHPGQLRLAAGRADRELRPGQDRHPRGRPLARALPHLPGRVHDHQRRGLRHPGPVQREQRVPRGSRLLLAAGPRPDPQLHGLLLRRLLHAVQRRSDLADAADVRGLPGLSPTLPRAPAAARAARPVGAAHGGRVGDAAWPRCSPRAPSTRRGCRSPRNLAPADVHLMATSKDKAVFTPDERLRPRARPPGRRHGDLRRPAQGRPRA